MQAYNFDKNKNLTFKQNVELGPIEEYPCPKPACSSSFNDPEA